MTARTSRVASGSSPTVGSSRKMTSGSCTRRRAMASFCFIPRVRSAKARSACAASANPSTTHVAARGPARERLAQRMSFDRRNPVSLPLCVARRLAGAIADGLALYAALGGARGLAGIDVLRLVLDDFHFAVFLGGRVVFGFVG